MSNQLGDHVEIASGFAFKSKKFGSEGDWPIIRIRDVKRGFSKTFYTGEYKDEFLVNDGDLLIGMDGEFNVQKWRGGPALLNQRVCKLTVNSEKLDGQYLFHFLPKQLKEIEEKTPFVTVKHLSAKTIKQIKIPLPPLDEQKRIAALLDKADGLRRKREKSIQLTDTLLRAVFLDMFGDPTKAVLGGTTLNDVASVHRGRFSPRPRNDPRYYGGDFPFIQTSEIAKANGYLSSHRQTLNELGIKVSKSFPDGTVFIAIVGATIGATAVSSREYWCPDSVIGIIPKSDGYPPEFLEYLLRFWRQVFVDQAPSTARANINLETLKPVPIPASTLEARLKFRDLYRRTNELQNRLEQMDLSLLQSLTQRAFTGELTG